MGKSRPPIERLMEKVRRLDNGCWEWTNYLESNGYARLWVDRRNVGAHRFSYEYHVGPIPEGLQIDHLCHYPPCVNPEHLEPVTAAENARRRRPWVPYQSFKTHCPEGHPYDDENTYTGSGGRACLICKRASARKYYERNRELTIERARTWRLENLERSREVSREAQRRQRAKKKAA
jgi:hypothetical protein